MRVYVYPADETGCGYYRLIWPARELIKRGHDIKLIMPGEDRMLTARLDADGVPMEVFIPDDADVIVMQRPTHGPLAACIPLIRAKGVAVVVDMDDDLSRIHPKNPAWRAMHPNPEMKFGTKMVQHSWENARIGSHYATLVTLSTDALIQRYARHGRSRVIRNCVPESFFDIVHRDSDAIGWPASIQSHPDDPNACGGGVAAVLSAAEQRLVVIGTPGGVNAAFGLGHEPICPGPVTLDDYPHVVSKMIGIGIAPLADTQFNAAKSWLKPLELAALGIPVVMSPRAEYAKIHQLGVGLIARHTSNWQRQLARLVTRPELRAEVAERGRAVAREWTIEKRAQDWADAWQHAYEIERSVVRSG